MNWHEHFTYEPTTGRLIRKSMPPEAIVKPGRRRDWITRYAGRVAGSIRSDGYVLVRVNKVYLLAHRIIWEMHYGPIPENMVVDHIDGVPSNNILTNIRICTRSQNQFNKGIGRFNHVGFKGVTSRNGGKTYSASLWHNGKKEYRGGFTTPEEAHEEYCRMAERFHKEFAKTT